jgi:hypothetical protein
LIGVAKSSYEVAHSFFFRESASRSSVTVNPGCRIAQPIQYSWSLLAISFFKDPKEAISRKSAPTCRFLRNSSLSCNTSARRCRTVSKALSQHDISRCSKKVSGIRLNRGGKFCIGNGLSKDTLTVRYGQSPKIKSVR